MPVIRARTTLEGLGARGPVRLRERCARGLRRLVLRAIHTYRRSGGGRRWFGIECNFEPGCSAFAARAIARHGLVGGGRMAWQRIRRCRSPDSVCKCLEPVPRSNGQ